MASAADSDQVVRAIEQIIDRNRLAITQKTTLSTMKGSIHYHLKSGKQPGVLEVTYWPEHRKLWVDIHENRRAEWNEQLIQPFAESLARAFGGIAEKRAD